MQRYNPKDIETKWQQKWEADKIYQATEDPSKPKKYILEYFPYPSGAAMHVGHVRNYTIGDVLARYNRMQGFNVLHPMGWDAFGLPAENYAIKNQVSPRVAIDQNTKRFKEQLMQMGFSYDWSREIDSTDPDYYRWTQWFFLLLYRKGLAYQKESPQWWCPVDKTVLANEQVEAGLCWRCGSHVEKKMLKQWFFKITDYADRLAADLDTVDWSDSIKNMQRNWIGKSKGAQIDFQIADDSAAKPNFVILHGFTGRADKNFIPWLKSQLETAGYEVQAPQMPNTDKPSEKEQVGYVLENCKIDENTVLVGHSLGSAVAMKVLQQLDHPIRHLVLLASVVEPAFRPVDYDRPFIDTFDMSYDYDLIKQKASKVSVISDTLEPNRKPYLEYLASKLNAEFTEITAEENHVTADVEPALLPILVPTITVFTTAHDTIYGATFMVLAPEHPLVPRVTTADHKEHVNSYVKDAQAKSEIERQETDRKKTGVFTGSYAINPVNGAKVPIWVADYVLAGYGHGAVMAVPGEDARDHEFAKKFELPIIYTTEQQEFIDYSDIKKNPKEFHLANSGEFDGLDFEQGRQKILEKLEGMGAGKQIVNYKIRDWLISRQRYWGAPIPMIHCPKDGIVPVPEDQLPVKLPELEKFEPAGDGRSPLATVPEFVNVECPKCGGPAERETDTMDGFACSSWYFLRFADPHNSEKPFDADKAKFWLPVDDYIGGAEHAVMHLLYARMWTKVMHDEGLIDFDEPFTKLRNQGMILAPDGSKMSKSKGNTIEPGVLIDQGYGADSIRIMELFIGPWNQAANWSVEGMGGAFRFLQRIWTLVQEFNQAVPQPNRDAELTCKIMHSAIKKVSDDISQMSFNTAIAALMLALNELYKVKQDKGFVAEDWHAALTAFVQLLTPFAPHITEEMWQQLGGEGSVHASGWPTYDEKYLVSDTVKIAVQVNGKVRAELELPSDVTEQQAIEAALAHEKVKSFTETKEIRKTIYIPGKLVSVVV